MKSVIPSHGIAFLVEGADTGGFGGELNAGGADACVVTGRREDVVGVGGADAG